MANSRYTYDDFTSAANAAGLLSDFDADDLRNARANPDAAMTLLGYKKDYASAMRSGNDTAAYLAQDGINRIKAGYAPAAQNDTSGGTATSFSPAAGTAAAPAASSAGTAGTTAVQAPSSAAAPSAGTLPYNLKDVAKVIKNQAGYDTGDVSGYDVNSDGKVNLKDSSYMIRRLAGYDDAAATQMARDNAALSPADYSGEYSRLLGEYLTGDVDVEGSDLWKNYAKAYTREGDRAAQRTVDSYAAANGGQVSSYAQSAAAQQRNYYMSQLADLYPEIYSQLRSEQADRLSALSSAMDREQNRVLIAAQYGDVDALRELGIDPTRYLEEQDYQKRAQEALYAAQYGDYTLLDLLFGSNVKGAQADKEKVTALLEALGYGDASGFDERYGTSVGKVLSDQKDYERRQTELSNAYTLAQLGMYDELAALTGRSVDELKAAFEAAAVSSGSSGTSGGSSSSGGSTSIPSAVNTLVKGLAGDNIALTSKLYELVTDGTITEDQGNYLLSLYSKKYTTAKQAIEAGAPEDTWSEAVYTYAKTSTSNSYPWLPDTYEEYLDYMVAKGNGTI